MFTEEQKELIEDALNLYVSTSERFVSYDEAIDIQTKVKAILEKLTQSKL